LLPREALFALLIGLPWTFPATGHAADEPDSSAADVSPTPAHPHKHHHPRKSPTASPSPSDDVAASPTPKARHSAATGEPDTDADVTPTPKKRHHFDADSDDSAADVSPSPEPFSAYIHKHRRSKLSPTPSPGDEAASSPTPNAHQEASTGDADSDADVTPTSGGRRHHHHPADGEEPVPAAEPGPPIEASDAMASATPKPRPSVAPDANLDTDQLQDFSEQPGKIQGLIAAALELTRQNLTYTEASADPANGGLDCSGYIYYLLTQAGIGDVPRDASGQYSWVRKADNFRAVISRRLDGFELNELKPGDLLFWTGTYKTDHDPPVTHVMLYLGREKETGNRVMAGSADGRSYHGLRRWGVSVFDFKETAAASPSPGGNEPRFIGYGAIPGLQAAP
jgi:cell wall-associated NlpC family hydrolase